MIYYYGTGIEIFWEIHYSIIMHASSFDKVDCSKFSKLQQVDEEV